MVRVLVVGAGPTGLTAAVELARRGHQPTVIERREGPSSLSRAVGLSRRSIALLRPSGVAEAILDEAVEFSAIRIHRGVEFLAELPLNFDERSRLWGLAQDRTEAHLREALVRWGGEVRYGVALTGFERDEAGVTAHFGGAQERFNYLIGADGAHSKVREGLGLAFRGFDLPGVWSIADVASASWCHPGAFQLFLLPRGNVAVVAPMERERFRIIATLPDALEALPVQMDVSQVKRTGTFAIAVRQVDRYKVGRVLLAGDAAHCHSPAGGRGMNLGIADAADLAARIAEGGLDAYSQVRHAAGAEAIRASEAARRRVQASDPLSRALLVGTIRAASAMPRLRRAAVHRLISE